MKYRKYDIIKNNDLFIANSWVNSYPYLISSNLDILKQQIDNEIKQLKLEKTL
jgi:hypothetical protein